jgi:hypothetical protein
MTVRSGRVCVSVTSSVGRRATDQRAIGIAIAIAGVREVGPRGMFVQMSVFHRFLVHVCVHVHTHHTTHPPTARYSMSHAAMYVDRITCRGWPRAVSLSHAWPLQTSMASCIHGGRT